MVLLVAFRSNRHDYVNRWNTYFRLDTNSEIDKSWWHIKNGEQSGINFRNEKGPETIMLAAGTERGKKWKYKSSNWNVLKRYLLRETQLPVD